MGALAIVREHSSRRVTLGVVLAVALPLAAAAVMCTLMHTQWRSPFAPLLGPWAGQLYGHWDCTIAKCAPAWAAASTLLAASAILAVWFAPPTWRVTRIALVALAALIWSHAAVASVVNTLS